MNTIDGSSGSAGRLCRGMMSEPGETLFSGHDVYEKVELVGLCEGLCDVGAGERATLVGVCDDERASRHLCDEDYGNGQRSVREGERATDFRRLCKRERARPPRSSVWGRSARVQGTDEKETGGITLTSGSLFITFLILAKGNGGCL